MSPKKYNHMHSVTLMPQPTKWIEIGENSVDESHRPDQVDGEEPEFDQSNQNNDDDCVAVFAQESSIEEVDDEGQQNEDSSPRFRIDE